MTMVSNPSVIPHTLGQNPQVNAGNNQQTPPSRYNIVARTQAEIDKIEPVVL